MIRIFGAPSVRTMVEQYDLPPGMVEQRIDEAEGGGISANGQRERGDRHRGENRRPAERA